MQASCTTIQTCTAPSSKLLKSSLKCIGINTFVKIDAFSCFFFCLSYLHCVLTIKNREFYREKAMTCKCRHNIGCMSAADIGCRYRPDVQPSCTSDIRAISAADIGPIQNPIWGRNKMFAGIDEMSWKNQPQRKLLNL